MARGGIRVWHQRPPHAYASSAGYIHEQALLTQDNLHRQVRTQSDRLVKARFVACCSLGNGSEDRGAWSKTSLQGQYQKVPPIGNCTVLHTPWMPNSLCVLQTSPAHPAGARSSDATSTTSLDDLPLLAGLDRSVCAAQEFAALAKPCSPTPAIAPLILCVQHYLVISRDPIWLEGLMLTTSCWAGSSCAIRLPIGLLGTILRGALQRWTVWVVLLLLLVLVLVMLQLLLLRRLW